MFEVTNYAGQGICVRPRRNGPVIAKIDRVEREHPSRRGYAVRGDDGPLYQNPTAAVMAVIKARLTRP